MTNKASTVLALFCLGLLSGCGIKSEAPTDQLEVAAIGVYAGAISDDANHAVVGSIHHGLSLWRLDDRERLYDWEHKDNLDTNLIAADFSADGEWAVTADEHTLVLWEISTGKAPRFWSVPAEILDIALTSDARTALLGLADHTAVLFDIQRGGILRTLRHNNRVGSVSVSRDNRIAVTGSEDYSAVSWDLQTGATLARMEHQDDVQLVRISPDGELVLSVSKYDKAVVWDANSGEIVGEVPLAAERLKRGLSFSAATFSEDNQYLVTGRVDQIVSLWRLADMAEIKRWKIPKRKAWKPTGAAILAIAFANPGEIKALASNGFIATLEFSNED